MRRLHQVGPVLLIVLAIPSGADAKPGYEVHPGGIKMVLSVAVSRGRVMSVSVNKDRRIQFTADGPSVRTEYTTTGRVNHRRIKATFGALGRVDVRLHLGSPRPPGPPHHGSCKGRASLSQEGSYTGTVEFSHEGAVPEVSAEHGRVYFTRHFRQVCQRERSPSLLGGKKKLRRKIEVGFLAAGGKANGRTVFLEALNFTSRRNRAHSGGLLRLATYERRDHVRITRTTSTWVDHDSFAMSRPGQNPETIDVELSKPFAGHALYSRSPGSLPSWTGDLRVNFAGAGSIPLAGPSFSAILCRGFSFDKLKRCVDAGLPTFNPFALATSSFALNRGVQTGV